MGTFQWAIIRKDFTISKYWIPASVLGWGLGHIDMFNFLTFFLGGIALGFITGLFFTGLLVTDKPAIH